MRAPQPLTCNLLLGESLFRSDRWANAAGTAIKNPEQIDFKRFFVAQLLLHSLRGRTEQHVAPSYTSATDHLCCAAQTKKIRTAKEFAPNSVSACWLD
jgi:hypothetical protein